MGKIAPLAKIIKVHVDSLNTTSGILSHLEMHKILTDFRETVETVPDSIHLPFGML